MKSVWRQVLSRILIGFIVSIALGFLSGQIFLFLFLYTLYLLYCQFYQLFRFHSWLRFSGRSAPPESSGIWGEVFNNVHRLQKKQRKTKKRMQKALSRIEKSTSALKEGVIMADNTGRLEWWNQSATDMLGLMKTVDRGQFITNIVRAPEFFRYFSQKRFADALIISSPIKEGIYLEIQTTLYSQNDHLIFIRDVTRLHSLEQMRKDFVANASHELRTPLTVIKGYLETLSLFQDSLPQAMQKGVANMSEQSARMEQLIEDLLLLSRLESQEEAEQEEWHTIKDFVHSITNAAKVVMTENHQFDIHIEDDDSLYGSYSQLYSAFSNLIFNAIKYSPAGGTITIKWKSTPISGIFCVADQGIGIDPRYIPRLTERFFRVDKGRGPSTGGTGLGLAIVKHALLNHDGKLIITSEPNEGSKFSCHFPENRVKSNELLKNENHEEKQK
ncbi:phosphate regulon sensor histidine kinase PhoR [Marinomonas agarivorans]|nr:phosphate regulon sensor histidine kinase PhoR [Marinomonas agarivorans]